MTTDILLIHPGNHRKNYQDLSKEYTAVSTPVWTLLIANFCRKHGYAPRIYDVNISGWTQETAGELLSRFNPALVVLMVYGHNPSASTQTMPAAGRIARDLRKSNSDIPIAMGGIHPSALPEQTLREEAVDFVIQGEGPLTVVGLIQYLGGKEKLRAVKGLWFREGDRMEYTGPAPLIENLDQDLDDYAWDLLPDLSGYRAHNMHCFQDFEHSATEDFSDVRSPYVAINTSLGCPYNCHYCCINSVFGKKGVRYWSLDTVFFWLDTIVSKYKVRNIRFDDELFILSPKRVERFCDMMIDRGYDLNIWVYGRVDTIYKPLLRKLKQAGINWICLGIESASEKVRNQVNKNIRTDIRETVRSIQAQDIYVLGNYMVGLPEDTLETMEETLKLAMDLNCEYANIYSVMAYPGSGLYDWASGIDGYLPDSWEGFSQLGYETKPLPTKHLPSADVLRFRDEAFARYNTNPLYLRMMEEKFGGRVKSHLEKMLAIKLRRKILETNERGPIK